MMKKKVKIFDIVLIVIFTVFSLVMIIPVYKVLVDSFDLKTAYGMKLSSSGSQGINQFLPIRRCSDHS